MSKLINSVGDLLYPNGKYQLDRAKNIIKPQESNIYLDRLPYDQSAFGFLDKTLRKLPPSVAREVARITEIGTFSGIKYVSNEVNQLLSIFLYGSNGISYDPNSNTPIKLGPQVNGLVTTLRDKIDSILYGNYTENLSVPNSNEFNLVRLNQSKDNITKGLKISVSRNSKNTPELNEVSSELVNEDLSNSLKFIPKEDLMWVVTLDRYEDELKSALPKLPVFKSDYSLFNDKYKGGIDYSVWLPSTSYNYNRRSIDTSTKFSYGWGREFNQVTSIKLGGEFKVDLVEDRNLSFSKYAKEVMDISASYDEASMTYWRHLVFKIGLTILNKQWQPIHKYVLLGILQNDGIMDFMPEIGSTVTYNFDIVGEVEAEEFINNEIIIM